jgi:hypothetical protein
MYKKRPTKGKKRNIKTKIEIWWKTKRRCRNGKKRQESLELLEKKKKKKKESKSFPENHCGDPIKC